MATWHSEFVYTFYDTLISVWWEGVKLQKLKTVGQFPARYVNAGGPERETYLLITGRLPSIVAIPMKLTFVELAKSYSHFMKLECLLTNRQNPATFLYPKPDECSFKP